MYKATPGIPRPEDNPEYFVQVLDTILPQMATDYKASSVISKLTPLCAGLKRFGKELEAQHKDKLDMMQIYFTDICKDSAIDITLRLKILEIIELRSLDWNSNPQMEHFYQEKLSQFREKVQQDAAKRKTLAEAFSSKVKGDKTTKSTKDGDNLRFQTSVQELFPNSQLRKRECIVVDVKGAKVKLFLSSANTELMKDAKICLSQYFSTKSSSRPSGVQYSKEDLMTLSTSPPSMMKPANFPVNMSEIVKKL